MLRKMKAIIISITITLLCVGCSGKSAQGQAAMEQTGTEQQSAEEEQLVIGVQNTEEAEELIVESSLVQQIGMKGRTDEETRLMRKIWQDNEEEFQAFLTEDNEFTNWIEFDVYDFTGDGQEEMIAMKCYVGNSPDGSLSLLSYNYVYDQTGEKMIEFVGSGNTEIIRGWDGDGTFLLRDSNSYSIQNDADIYTEIRWENGVLEENVQLMELDCRVAGCTGKEGYYIFRDFTKEEEEKLWHGGEGAQELTETKEYVWEDKRLEEYERLFDTSETTKFSAIGSVYYSDREYRLYFEQSEETVLEQIINTYELRNEKWEPQLMASDLITMSDGTMQKLYLLWHQKENEPISMTYSGILMDYTDGSSQLLFQTDKLYEDSSFDSFHEFYDIQICDIDGNDEEDILLLLGTHVSTGAEYYLPNLFCMIGLQNKSKFQFVTDRNEEWLEKVMDDLYREDSTNWKISNILEELKKYYGNTDIIVPKKNNQSIASYVDLKDSIIMTKIDRRSLYSDRELLWEKAIKDDESNLQKKYIKMHCIIEKIGQEEIEERYEIVYFQSKNNIGMKLFDEVSVNALSIDEMKE